MALNILDMLIVERSTTSERIGGIVRDEIAIPMQLVREAATGVAAGKLDAHERLEAALETLETRIRSATGGPQTVLGIDKIEHRSEPDPVIAGKRILVADDEAGVRDAIKSILGEAGASVDVRADGGSALDAVARAIADQRPYDLVVSDVRMPDRNGYEVFRGTRDMSPGTPVLLMTGFGYDPNHSIVRSSQEGLQCCLFKPFQAAQLIEEVRKALVKQA
jgi:CheY-like chemotaxis protein